MLKCNGFSAWISVDDVELPQYGVETDETGNKVSCWIESKDGQPFSVKWCNVACSVPTGGYITVDGIDVGGKASKRVNREPASFEKVVVSSNSARGMMFSSLNLTDNDSYLSAETLNNIGEITLSIWEEEDTIKPTPTPEKDLPKDYKIHERTKKGLAHRVKFGDTETVSEMSMVETALVRLIATFIFWYRSLDILRAKDIVPNQRAGLSTAEKRKLDDSVAIKDEIEEGDEDEDDEIKALEDKLRTLKERRGKTKRVKLENVLVFKPGEVIDLT